MYKWPRIHIETQIHKKRGLFQREMKKEAISLKYVQRKPVISQQVIFFFIVFLRPMVHNNYLKPCCLLVLLLFFSWA